MKTLTNPFNYVKNTRQSYSKFYQKEFTEVEVQVDSEDPAWIPLNTLLAMRSIYNKEYYDYAW